MWVKAVTSRCGEVGVWLLVMVVLLLIVAVLLMVAVVELGLVTKVTVTWWGGY